MCTLFPKTSSFGQLLTGGKQFWKTPSSNVTQPYDAVTAFAAPYELSSLLGAGHLQVTILSFPQHKTSPTDLNMPLRFINDKCCHYQRNIPQHYYLLDALVISRNRREVS